jgi:hypothetical protein
MSFTRLKKLFTRACRLAGSNKPDRAALRFKFKQQDLEPSLLKALDDPDLINRLAAACSDYATERSTLKALRDPNFIVCLAAINRSGPSVTETVLLTALDSDFPEVVEAARHHPKMTPAILNKRKSYNNIPALEGEFRVVKTEPR